MKTALLIFVVFCSSFAFAKGDSSSSKDKNVRARLFVGNYNFGLDEINSYTQPKGINPLNNIFAGGVEAAAPLFLNISAGIRATWKWNLAEEVNKTPGAINPYYTSIRSQETIGVVRMALAETAVLKADVFGGIGVAENTLDIHAATGSGTWEGTSMMSMAGVSAAIGYGGLFIFTEAGQEWHKAKDLKPSPNSLTTGLKTLEMSGVFFNVGLMFQGIPSFMKKGK